MDPNLDGSPLLALANEIILEITQYLSADTLAKLYCTMDRRLQRKLSFPGLIRSLVLTRTATSGAGELAYLLAELTSLESLELTRTVALSPSLVKNVSQRSSPLRSLKIGYVFMEVFSKDLQSIALEPQPSTCAPEMSKIPLIRVGPHYIPDFRLLFPSLEVLHLPSSLRTLVTCLIRGATHQPPLQTADQLIKTLMAVLPPNLREFTFAEYLPTDMPLSEIYPLLPPTLTHLEVGIGTLHDFFLSGVAACFPSLRSLALETRSPPPHQQLPGAPPQQNAAILLDQTGENSQIFLPSTLTRLELTGSRTYETLFRNRLSFSNLSDLQHLSIGIHESERVSASTQSVDLHALLLPTSIQSLKICSIAPLPSAFVLPDRLEVLRNIVSLPKTLTRLELVSNSVFGAADIKRMMPLLSSLEHLTSFIDKCSASLISSKQLKMFPKSLTRLDTSSNFLREVFFSSMLTDGTAQCFKKMKLSLHEDVEAAYTLPKNLRFLRCPVPSLRSALLYAAVNPFLNLQPTTHISIGPDDQTLLQLAGLRQPNHTPSVDQYVHNLTNGRIFATTAILDTSILGTLKRESNQRGPNVR